jgi:FtsH-binding integral membrane protein
MDTYASVHERVQNTVVARTFLWLAGGLVLSGAVAAYVGTSDELYDQLRGNTILFWGVFLAPIGIILLLGATIDRLSVTAASSLYLLFCFLEGLALSAIFQVYTTSSVAQVFFIAAAMFAVAGTIGFVTERDLTKLGGILMIGLIGFLLATLVNLFWANDALYWVTTYVGVAIFLGLAVYDFNLVKKQSREDLDTETQAKASLWLAIGLYLDFVNLFLLLLRIFGSRN